MQKDYGYRDATRDVLVHYRLTQQEMRAKYKSNGSFAEAAACGHGSPIHQLRSTRDSLKVTCGKCKKFLKYKQLYGGA